MQPDHSTNVIDTESLLTERRYPNTLVILYAPGATQCVIYILKEKLVNNLKMVQKINK